MVWLKERASPARVSMQVSDVPETEVAVFVKSFLTKAEEIMNMFTDIDKKIKEVTDLQSALLEFSETDERLFTFYDGIKKGFVKIAEKIGDLETSFDIKRFYGSDTEVRICNTQLLTLRRKLTRSVGDYYNIQEEYKEKCRARVKRQAQISGADMSKIDFDAAVASKTDLFLQAVFPDYNVAQHYMKQIEKRHEDFLKLEKSISELRDLIFDINLIVRADNPMINRIDKHTQVVDSLVIEGYGSVKAYRKSLRTHRYKYYIGFCCCGVVVFIIMLAALAAFA